MWMITVDLPYPFAGYAPFPALIAGLTKGRTAGVVGFARTRDSEMWLVLTVFPRVPASVHLIPRPFLGPERTVQRHYIIPQVGL